jgi:hypothetical protein
MTIETAVDELTLRTTELLDVAVRAEEMVQLM